MIVANIGLYFLLRCSGGLFDITFSFGSELLTMRFPTESLSDRIDVLEKQLGINAIK